MRPKLQASERFAVNIVFLLLPIPEDTPVRYSAGDEIHLRAAHEPELDQEGPSASRGEVIPTDQATSNGKPADVWDTLALARLHALGGFRPD